MIIGIVTVDRNWGIGKKGRRVTDIPDEIKYVRTVTADNAAVMGRCEYESIIRGQLPVNRLNVVLTSKDDYKAEPGVVVVHSPDEAIKRAKEGGRDVYIVGGGKTFASFMNLMDEIQVTYVDYSYDVDARFPNLDLLPEWVMVSESDEQTHFDTVYYWRKYVRRKYYQA